MLPGNEPFVSPIVLPVLPDCPSFFFALAAVGFMKLEPDQIIDTY